LLVFGGINAVATDTLIADLDRVAINDTGFAGNAGLGGEREQDYQRGDGR
jgi:hypothetical protein